MKQPTVRKKLHFHPQIFFQLQSFSIKSTISLLKINSRKKKNNSTKEDQNIKKISWSILKQNLQFLSLKKDRENYLKRVKQNESW